MNWWEDPEKVKQRAENYKKNFRKKHGVDNPQQLKEIKEKASETCRNRYGGRGFASKSLEKKSRDKMESRYGNRNIMKTEEGKKHFRGDKNPMKNPEVAAKTSKALKGQPSKLKGKTYEEILGSDRAETRKKEQKINGQKGWLAAPRISQPQIELFKMVQKKYPTAVMEYPVLDYCLDVAVPEEKIAFEYDGSYWHDQEKDKLRDSVLERSGWKVFRFIDQLPGNV